MRHDFGIYFVDTIHMCLVWLSRRKRILVCLLSMCVVARAQQTANTGSVIGVVHLADTGKAAVGITVFLQPPATLKGPVIDPKTREFIVRDEPHRGDFYAKVGPNGAFEIKNVKPGDYFVLTSAPGYISQDAYIFPGALAPRQTTGTLPAFVQKVHVTSGAATSVDLRLQRGGSIEGTVRLSDGRPAHTGAQIANEVAVSVEVKRKGGFIRSGGAAHTDNFGHYHIEGLAPASYVVFVALPGKMVPTSSGLQGSEGEIVYASSTVRASQARVVNVRGMENYDHVDIDIPIAGLHKVTGKVVTNTEAVMNNSAIVRLYPSGEPSLSRSTPLQADGSFSFDDVSDEEYTIAVDFHGESEMLGLTADKKGLRMKMKKAPYENVSQNIRVAGQDPPAVVLRTESTP